MWASAVSTTNPYAHVGTILKTLFFVYCHFVKLEMGGSNMIVKLLRNKLQA